MCCGDKMDEGVLIWFEHVERVGEESFVKRLYESEVREVRMRSRPRRGWNDCGKDVLCMRGRDIQVARECVHDGNEWSSICIVGGLTCC